MWTRRKIEEKTAVKQVGVFWSGHIKNDAIWGFSVQSVDKISSPGSEPDLQIESSGCYSRTPLSSPAVFPTFKKQTGIDLIRIQPRLQRATENSRPRNTAANLPPTCSKLFNIILILTAFPSATRYAYPKNWEQFPGMGEA